jgi:cytochrome P450
MQKGLWQATAPFESPNPVTQNALFALAKPACKWTFDVVPAFCITLLGSRMRARAVVLAASIAALAGCDSKPKEPPPDIIRSQRKAMDKANGVGDVLQKSADERREQTDQQK